MIPNNSLHEHELEHLSMHANYHLSICCLENLPQTTIMFAGKKMAQLQHSQTDFHWKCKNFLAKYLEIISHETYIQINRFAQSKLKANWNKHKKNTHKNTESEIGISFNRKEKLTNQNGGKNIEPTSSL